MALAQRQGRDVLTSDQVAASVNTNPVIIRRCLGDLRRAGLVGVRHGAGAGWSLARPAGEITLLEVHDAVGQEPPFGLHHAEPNLGCPVGRGIRPALSRVYGGPARARARAGFGGGPAWKAHSAAANATMIDSDNVLLLRPVPARSGFPAPAAGRPAAGSVPAGPSRILVTIYYRDQPFDQAFAD